MKILTVSRCSAIFPESRWGADNQALVVATQMSETAESYLVHRGNIPTQSRKNLKSIIVKVKMNIDSPIRTFYFIKGFVLSLLGGFGAISYIRRQGPFDVVISFSSVSTMLIRKLNKTQKLVHIVQDELIGIGDTKTREHAPVTERVVRVFLNRILETKAIKAANEVVTVSPYVYQQIASFLPKPNKARVLLPSLRNTFLEKASQQFAGNLTHSIILNTFDLDDFILSVGNMDGRKRFDLLIHSLPRVDSFTHVVLVGNGPKLQEYKDLASSLGLESRVHFFSSLPEEDLVHLYSKSRFVILISEREAFPTVVLEALYLGKDFLYINHASELLRDVLKNKDERYHTGTNLTVDDISKAIKTVNTCISSRDGIQSTTGSIIVDSTNIRNDICEVISALLPDGH